MSITTLEWLLFLAALFIIFLQVHNALLLRLIERRERRTQKELVARAEALEVQTAKIAADVAAEAERREVKAGEQHNRVIEAALEAREEAHKAAVVVTETHDTGKDTNIVVHAILETVTLTRSNPRTGEAETRDVTNQEWKDEEQALRGEGWQPNKDKGEDK